MSARLGADARVLLCVGLLGLLPACGAGEPESQIGSDRGAESQLSSDRGPESQLGSDRGPGPAAEPGPRTASPTSTEIPEGGLEDWVEEMRQRLEEIELDPRNSYPDVLRLYNTYQAAMERYYGSGGELTGTDHPALASAIQQQDSAFHELLKLTGTTRHIERTHLLHAIRNVRLAMEATLDRARAAGVPLERQ